MRIKKYINKDNTKTSLYGKGIISKADLLIHAIGKADELNSWLGLLIIELEISKIKDLSDNVRQIQRFLFSLGSDLATPKDVSDKFHIVRINSEHNIKLLDIVVQLEDGLPELKNFILPSGSKSALYAYNARAITRELERILVELMDKYPKEYGENFKEIQIFTNILSDLFFKMFRQINHRLGLKEDIWIAD